MPTPLASDSKYGVAAAAQQSRPLVIKQNGVEISIPVPIQLWPVAENIKELFPSTTTTTEGVEDFTEIELTASLLDFSLDRATTDSATFDVLPFVSVVFLYFHQKFLRTNNIHAVTRDISTPERRSTLLRTYYSALVALKRQGLVSKEEYLPTPSSALFDAAEAGRASLFAVFGGQGNVEDYFDELIALYTTYEALARPFVRQAALTLEQHSTSDDAVKQHAPKIAVLDWLEKPDTRPSTDNLLATHLSLPLIGLTQLLNYYVTFKALDKTPGELRNVFSGEYSKFVLHR